MSADVYLTYPPKRQAVTHKWKTAIQEVVFTGSEKRSALFTWPRLKINMEIHLHTSRRRQWFQRKLFGHTHEVWGVPIWPDKTALGSQAGSGQKILDVNSFDDRHFYADRDCIIVNPSNYESYEVGTIDTLDSSGITLKADLVNTWGSGSYVFPAFEFRIPDKNKIKRKSYNYDLLTLAFTEAFESIPAFAYSLPSSGADTYLGHDIFLNKPLKNMEYGYEHPYGLQQSIGVGFAESLWQDNDSSSGFGKKDSRINLSMKVIEKGRANIFALFDFFDSKRGKYDLFWIPTWQDNIVVDTAFSDIDTVIGVQDLEYTSYYLPNDCIGRYVLFRFPDYTYTCRKIDSASPTTITLDSQIGTTITADELNDLLVCFIYLSRFATDELTLNYREEEIAHSAIPFVNLLGVTP